MMGENPMGEQLNLVVVGVSVPPTTTEILADNEIAVRTVDSDETEILSADDTDCVIIEPTAVGTLPAESETGSKPAIIALVDDELPPHIDQTDVTEFLRTADLQDRGAVVERRVRTAVATTRREANSVETDQLRRAVDALTAVRTLTTDPDQDVTSRLTHLLETITDRLGYPIGYVARIDDEAQTIVAATGDNEQLNPGSTVPLEDAPNEGWADDPAFERFGFRSVLSAPIVVNDDIYGTLCFGDERPRKHLPGAAMQSTATALARRIGDELECDRYETGLTDSEKRLQSLFDEAPDAILVHDEDGSIIDANKAATNHLGYSRAELTSMNVWDVEVGVDRETLEAAWETLGPDETLTAEGIHQHADGTTHPTEVWINDIEVDGHRQFIAMSRDVSDRVEYEQELERQRDNLEILNQVVRHDIRNDLQLVQAYAEMLTDHVDSEASQYLDIIRESAENATDLTTTARDLAEVMLQPELEDQRVAVDVTIEQQLADVRSAYPDAAVMVETPLPSVDVVGNDMLGAVFRNLLKNAIQHNDSEVATVTVDVATADDDVEVRVADNGPGISNAQKKEIFGKGEKGLESDGTGIGLYLVQELVESCGGDVWVEDNDPTGAVFVVRLPRSSER